MTPSRRVLHDCLSLALMLSVAARPAIAVQTPEFASEQGARFRRIEQPLPLKIGATLGGFALIGLELWWFQFSKAKGRQ